MGRKVEGVVDMKTQWAAVELIDWQRLRAGPRPCYVMCYS